MPAPCGPSQSVVQSYHFLHRLQVSAGSLGRRRRFLNELDDYKCPKPALVEMPDDDKRRECTCCCQPCHDLMVKVGLLKLNTGMLATSLLSFDSRSDQLQTDESTANPRQHARDEASPVLPDYMRTTERPKNSLERMQIARYARTRRSAVVQEQIFDRQPATR